MAATSMAALPRREPLVRRSDLYPGAGTDSVTQTCVGNRLRRRESDREDFDRLLNADPAGAENGVQLEDSFLRHSSARWQALNDRIAGDVIQPDSPDYATARKPALARFGYVRPQAIVRCQTRVDVAMTLELA